MIKEYKTKLTKYLVSRIQEIYDLDFSNVEDVVIFSKEEKLGDLCSPVAYQIVSKLPKKKSPYDIACEIVEKFKYEGIENVSVAKNGYINFVLDSKFLSEGLSSINEEFGKVKKLGEKVMVEFGQPNTHKSVTVGHVRSAVTGECIARMYENMGYDVVRANYFGDIGVYVAKTLYQLLIDNIGKFEISSLKKSDIEKCLKKIEEVKKEGGNTLVKKYISSMYVSGSTLYSEDSEEYKVIKEINMLLFNKENELVNLIYAKTREYCIEYLDEFFATLGVKFDRQYPESEVEKVGREIVEKNIDNIFIRDSNAVIFPGEKYKGCRWVYLTSDGLPTYNAKDLGLVVIKRKEYPDLKFCLITTSVEQNAYFRDLITVVNILFEDSKDWLKHLGFGWVLLENKKTSSRKGTVEFEDMIDDAKVIARQMIDSKKEYTKDEIEEIVSKVVIGSIKFNFLSHEIHKDINYDVNKVLNMTGFSAPYVLYSYTRNLSILEKYGNKIINTDSKLVLAEEISLVKKMCMYEVIVDRACKYISPHLICEYLFELSNLYNSFYSKCNILDEEKEDLKLSRLNICLKYKYIVENALNILGIDVVSKM